MSNYTDQDCAIFPKTGSGTGIQVEEIEQDGFQYRSTNGFVATPNGFVRVHSHINKKRGGSSMLEMIKNGRCYYRWFKKEYTARGLVTKAKQFASELHTIGVCTLCTRVYEATNKSCPYCGWVPGLKP